MSSGIGSYATTATVYGRSAQDSYYQLSAPGLINGNVEITGNLKVDGTTELVGAVTCDAGLTADGLTSSDGVNKVTINGQTIQALSAAGAPVSLFLNGDLTGGGAVVAAPAGMTVGGAAVAPATPGLDVQTSAGRIAITAGSNFNQINSFDANAAAASLVLGAQGQPTEVNALTADSVLTTALANSGNFQMTFGGTQAVPLLPGATISTYSGVVQIPLVGGVNYFGDFLLDATKFTTSTICIATMQAPSAAGVTTALFGLSAIVTTTPGPLTLRFEAAQLATSGTLNITYMLINPV